MNEGGGVGDDDGAAAVSVLYLLTAQGADAMVNTNCVYESLQWQRVQLGVSNIQTNISQKAYQRLI